MSESAPDVEKRYTALSDGQRHFCVVNGPNMRRACDTAQILRLRAAQISDSAWRIRSVLCMQHDKIMTISRARKFSVIAVVQAKLELPFRALQPSSCLYSNFFESDDASPAAARAVPRGICEDRS
jgi:hypothetical protein